MSRFAAFSAGAAALAALALPAALASAQDAPAKPAVPVLTTEGLNKGRQLFKDNACGGCHTLADGGGAGSIGPSLDNNPQLSHALVVDRVTNGSGPMPGFGASLSKDDIDLLASYVIQSKK